jgi:hypothetical protein
VQRRRWDYTEEKKTEGMREEEEEEESIVITSAMLSLRYQEKRSRRGKKYSQSEVDMMSLDSDVLPSPAGISVHIKLR